MYFIIVTYNGLRWIERCLESVYNSNNPNVIVVDNASTDETVAFIRKKFPQVTLIALEKNIGFGAANNLAIKRAIEEKSDYFFLINQDVYIESNTLPALLSAMKQYPELGIVSPLHLNGSNTGFDQNFLYYLNSGSKNRFVEDVYFEREKNIYFVPFVNAAAWVISKKCIEQVGLFDSLFFHYGEDINYCQRVLYHNFKIGITSKAVILHDREDRQGKIRPEFIKEQNIRQLLIDVCNPFNDTTQFIKSFTKKNRLTIFKSLLKLDFKKVKATMEEERFLKHNKGAILKNTAYNREPRTLPN